VADHFAVGRCHFPIGRPAYAPARWNCGRTDRTRRRRILDAGYPALGKPRSVVASPPAVASVRSLLPHADVPAARSAAPFVSSLIASPGERCTICFRSERVPGSEADSRRSKQAAAKANAAPGRPGGDAPDAGRSHGYHARGIGCASDCALLGFFNHAQLVLLGNFVLK
jgi:hypothetical protein